MPDSSVDLKLLMFAIRGFKMKKSDDTLLTFIEENFVSFDSIFSVNLRAASRIVLVTLVTTSQTRSMAMDFSSTRMVLDTKVIRKTR